MDLQIFTLLVVTIGIIFITICLILFWGKVKEINNKVNQTTANDYHQNLDNIELRVDNKLNLMMNMINSQSSLISSFSNRINHFNVVSKDFEKKPLEPTEDKFSKEISQNPSKELFIKEDNDNETTMLNPEVVEKKLDSLLNGTDFTESIWQQFSKPFDVCVDMLIKYLGEHGMPMPRIQPYPAIKDNNPNFWTFMIIQAQNWKDEGRRFVIPRNFDRYDPLWHKHLFDVRGNVNKPDSYINGLVRCAIIINGNLSGSIDKRLVEEKGIISVD